MENSQKMFFLNLVEDVDLHLYCCVSMWARAKWLDMSHFWVSWEGVFMKNPFNRHLGHEENLATKFLSSPSRFARQYIVSFPLKI